MTSLAVALGLAVYVVADLVYGGGNARLAAAAVSGAAALIWFVLPLFYRSTAASSEPEASGQVEHGPARGRWPSCPRPCRSTWRSGAATPFRVRNKNFVFCDDTRRASP